MVQRASQGEVGRLVIGFVMSATCSILPGILRNYRKRFPGVELTLHESTTGDGISALREKKMHFCFLRLPVREEELSSIPVLHEQIVLAVPRGHRLGNAKNITLRSLANEDFILFPREDGPGFHDLIVGMCHQAGFSPRVVQVASQMQTILALVATGIGVALVPASVRTLRREGLCYRDLREQTATTGLALAWNKEMSSPSMENFIEQCRSAM
jgi:DNA-binding transcriptional LysR family regulator